MAVRLPQEVITHIMRFLNVSDRKEAAMVNKTWYEASLDPILQRDVVLHFNGETNYVPLSTFSYRRLSHLALSQLDNSMNTKHALLKSCQQFNESLKSLSFKSCNITESTFVEILSYCTNLTSIDLSSCNSIFLSGKLLEKNADLQLLRESLKNVKDLNISSIRQLSDVTFNRIVTICPNVEKITLVGSHIVFSSEHYIPRAKSRVASSAVLTFNNILDFVRVQASLLTSIDLSRNQINDDALESLVTIPDLHLQELHLLACKEIEDQGIIALSHNQKSLKILDLKDCIGITDAGISAVATNLVHLENLALNRCRNVTSISIKKFRNLSHLQTLEMSDLYQVTSSGVEEGLCGNAGMPLTRVNLSCCSLIQDGFVEKLSCTHPYLVHLDLGSCNNLTNQSIFEISKNLKQIQFLRLAWCKKITDLGILGFEQDIGEKKPTETGCNKNYESTTIFRKPISKEEKMKVQKLKEEIIEQELLRYKLSNLSKLRDLDLSMCLGLTDIGLVQVLKFQELRYLNLNMIPITNVTVFALTASNPSLEHLVLAKCAAITDDAIEAVAKRLPRLNNLNLSSCDSLTDKSIRFIQIHCKRLRSLDVSFCRNISPEAIDDLERYHSVVSVNRRLVGGKT
ncbi:F-box/LRR-repeat protein 14-like [Saccostrea cucullata]|uniref:F-box/LRR-repeat protein 14-like n=1 Tax=Saccostrea cuccullata TaxID=36930 RepID=UPI002ED21BA7